MIPSILPLLLFTIIVVVTITTTIIIVFMSSSNTTRRNASHVTAAHSLGARRVTRYGALCTPPTVATQSVEMAARRDLPQATA